MSRTSLMTDSRQPPLMTTGAAAQVAGCHPVTILRAIHSGELEAIRLGRRGDHRVHVDALNRWLHPTTDEETTDAHR